MSQSPAQFAVRTLRALEVVAFTPGTAPQVADALGVHPRTARRLLGQLQRDGWLSYSNQTPRVYAPTLRLLALAAHVGTGAPLATVTAPALEQLHTDTGLDVSLAIPSYGATALLLCCCRGHRAHLPLGGIVPAHQTAPGNVLMAYRDAWRRSIIEAEQADGIVDPETLERRLSQIRYEGWAIDDDRAGAFRQVAAPVAAPGGEVIAAVTLTLGTAPPEGRPEQVRAAAHAASAALAEGAERYPLHRAIVYRLLASYGLAPVDAYV